MSFLKGGTSESGCAPHIRRMPPEVLRHHCIRCRREVPGCGNAMMADVNAGPLGLTLMGLLFAAVMALALPVPHRTPAKTEINAAPKPSRVQRHGVAVEYSAIRAEASAPDKALLEGDYADIRFKVTDVRTRSPMTGRKRRNGIHSGGRVLKLV